MDKDGNSMTLTIYVLWPGDTEEDCIKEMNQLGQITYPKVYPDPKKTPHIFHRKAIFTKMYGYGLLESLVMNDSKILPHITIISSKSKKYTIEEFYDLLSKVDFIK